MPTISSVCANLFSHTNLSKLEKTPDRATRRALARAVYRQGRRPGLVNPQGPGPKPAGEHRNRRRSLGVSQRPMRHVYKHHEPKLPKPGTLAAKLRLNMVPAMFKYSQTEKRRFSGHPQRAFKAAGRI